MNKPYTENFSITRPCTCMYTRKLVGINNMFDYIQLIFHYGQFHYTSKWTGLY